MREFRQPLFLFALAIIGSGWLYYLLAIHAREPVGSLAEAFYITLTLTFFQPAVVFPAQWYLQVFFFFMPLVGIGLLALGLTDFGILLFNRRARGKEWEMAVASTLNNHVVLVGLGHLGYRIVQKLNEFDQDIVVVERSPEPDLLHHVRALGVPVIEDDGTHETVLKAAGVPRARVIVLCTQNDSLNLRMALKARGLNPKIEVVVRIFDDEFAASLQSQFGFHAMSATSMAAPFFASIAAHIDITPPINIEGQAHILANLKITERSILNCMTISQLEDKYCLSVVLLSKNGQKQFHPVGQEMVSPGCTIAILGEPEQVNRLIHESNW